MCCRWIWGYWFLLTVLRNRHRRLRYFTLYMPNLWFPEHIRTLLHVKVIMFNGRVLTVGTVREHLRLTLSCIGLIKHEKDRLTVASKVVHDSAAWLFLKGAASLNVDMISLVMNYLKERNSHQTLDQKLGVKSSWRAVKPPDTGPEHPLRL